MNTVRLHAAIALGLLMATATANADSTKNTANTKHAAADSSTATSAGASGTGLFSYTPPMRGAPAARIGGGTRGVGGIQMVLAVLAPDSTGLTTKAQPTLYWYASKAVPTRLEVTLINADKTAPVLKKIVPAMGKKAGIQSINLAKTDARLTPGKEYRWFVDVIANPKQRSDDVVASGTIERIIPGTALKKELANANDLQRAAIYAKKGIWYDAIDKLTRMIDKSPSDTELQKQRTALLEQVGLHRAAEYTKTHTH